MSKPLILGIAGASGSGKTRLAEELARELGGVHFHLDHYYRDLSHLTFHQRCRVNFDHPDELESDLLIDHIRRLATGDAVQVPQYDFASYTRVPGKTTRVLVDRLLVVDGIFALYYEGLRALYDFSIYVDAPDEICYKRRLVRDVDQRGRTPESVAAHYAETVRPMAEQYVRPTSRYAGLIVDGTASLDWSTEQVLSSLRKRGLLELINARS